MDVRLIRGLINFFLAVLAVFFVLLLVNFAAARLRPAKPEPRRDGGADAAMRRMPGNPVARRPLPPEELPSGRTGLSTAAAGGDGTLMVVKEKGFKEVAEKPKDMMERLNELGGNPKKPAPVAFGADAWNKKILTPSAESTDAKLTGGEVPQLDKPGKAGQAMVTAPVDYKVFKERTVWDAFAEPRRIKIQHDFSASDLVVLVPMSDFPAGIFKIAVVENGPKAVVVKYRVDPLVMAAGFDEALRSKYAYAPVPKKCPSIKLEQVP